MKTGYYITTPIYYVNAQPHVGHAYTSIAADVLARWHRLLGEDVHFQTGTDEHGLKIEQAATKAGLSPQAQADRYSAPFRALNEPLLLSPDDFIRTTEPRHKTIVAELWRRMAAKGDLYEGSYAGWYSVSDEAFFTEDELVEGRAPSGHPVVWTEEPTWFFRLSKYGPALLEHLRAHPEFVRPQNRYNEVLRFVEAGLHDLSVSRTSFSWGIPVPDCPAEGPQHVIYVWLDALANYVTALGGPEGAAFGRFWPADLHLVGKDILRFHAIYWPCFLMSLGLPLPKQIFAHGWWTVEGEKMSKSLGNAVEPLQVVARYGAEALRYFLLREVNFGSDGDFSEQALRNRINGDLANDLGNLLNRTLGMVRRYRDGVVPSPGPYEAVDLALIEQAKAQREVLMAAMDEIAFAQALAALMRLSSAANKYVDETAPWTLARNGEAARLDTVLYALCEVLRHLGIYISAFMPIAGPEMLRRLAVPEGLRSLESTASFGALPAGGRTEEGEPLFPRVEDEFTGRRREKAQARSGRAGQDPTQTGARGAQDHQQTQTVKEKKMSEQPEQPIAAQKIEPTVKTVEAAPDDGPEPIDYSVFQKLDLRVATVLSAEKHPNADRLLVVTLDAGEPQPRTICAGIVGHYEPEALVGRQVVLLANLKPRKMRGVMSHGMLLAAGDEQVKLLALDGVLPPGTRIS